MPHEQPQSFENISIAEAEQRIRDLHKEKLRIEDEIRKLQTAIDEKMESESAEESPQFSTPVTLPLYWLEPTNDTELLKQFDEVLKKKEAERGRPYPDRFRDILREQVTSAEHDMWARRVYEDYKLIADGEMEERTNADITAGELMKKYSGWTQQDFVDLIDLIETENPAELLDSEPTNDSSIVAEKFIKIFDEEFEEHWRDPIRALRDTLVSLLEAQEKFKGIQNLSTSTIDDSLMEYTSASEEYLDGESITNLTFMDELVARTKYDISTSESDITCNKAAMQKALVKFLDVYHLPKEPYGLSRNPF